MFLIKSGYMFLNFFSVELIFLTKNNKNHHGLVLIMVNII